MWPCDEECPLERDIRLTRSYSLIAAVRSNGERPHVRCTIATTIDMERHLRQSRLYIVYIYIYIYGLPCPIYLSRFDALTGNIHARGSITMHERTRLPQIIRLPFLIYMVCECVKPTRTGALSPPYDYLLVFATFGFGASLP